MNSLFSAFPRSPARSPARPLSPLHVVLQAMATRSLAQIAACLPRSPPSQRVFARSALPGARRGRPLVRPSVVGKGGAKDGRKVSAKAPSLVGFCTESVSVYASRWAECLDITDFCPEQFCRGCSSRNEQRRWPKDPLHVLSLMFICSCSPDRPLCSPVCLCTLFIRSLPTETRDKF